MALIIAEQKGPPSFRPRSEEAELFIGSQRSGWEFWLCLFGVTLGLLYIVSCSLSKCFIRDGEGGTRGEGAVVGRKAKKKFNFPKKTHTQCAQSMQAMAHSKIELSPPHSGL